MYSTGVLPVVTYRSAFGRASGSKLRWRGGRFPRMRWFRAKWDIADDTSLWGERLKRIFSLGRKRISFWRRRALSLSVWKSFSVCVGFCSDCRVKLE